MKQCIMVFLVFAFAAGGVFAESRISFSGEAEIGATTRFPQGIRPIPPTWSDFYRENQDTSMDNTYVDFSVNYDNHEVAGGHFHTALTFSALMRNQTHQAIPDKFEVLSRLQWLASYEANRYKIAAGLRTSNFSFADFADHRDNITYLYGWFYLLDDELKFDIAYKGYDSVDEKYSYSEDLPLASDVVATWNLTMPNMFNRLLPWWGNFEGIDGMRLTWTPLFLEDLVVRLAWRDLFTFKDVHLWWLQESGVTSDADFQHTVWNYFLTFTFFARYNFDSLLNIPLAVSFGYANRASRSIHLGASYAITDTLSANGDIMITGIRDFDSYGLFAIGGNVDYSSAPLYANMYIRYGSDRSENNGVIQLEPIIKFAIIPNTLLIKTGIDFGFGTGFYSEYRRFYVSPGIYWNVKRDADTDEPVCGIRITYTYGFATFNRGSDPIGMFPTTTNMRNDLSFSFHWAF